VSFEVRISKAVQEDLQRLLDVLAPMDYSASLRPRAAIERGYEFLEAMPFSCRKADDANAFLRELVVPFGGAGHVVLFEITDGATITILAVRHQREDDYHSWTIAAPASHHIDSHDPQLPAANPRPDRWPQGRVRKQRPRQRRQRMKNVSGTAW
jgi:plasmid stabilization system protein ParE